MSKHTLLNKLSIGIASLVLICSLTMSGLSVSNVYFNTPKITAHADVSTIVYNAFTKHGARKVGTANDDGVKGPIYEVIRNGQKIDWDSNDMTIKINGHNPHRNSSGDALNPVIKLVDSSNQYNNTSSNKISKPKVNNKSKNKINVINRTKNKATEHHKPQNNSNISKPTSNKPVKHTTKKTNHKNFSLIAGVVVILLVALGIIGGIKHHNNKNRYYY